MSYQFFGSLMLGTFVVSLLYPWSPSWPGAKWLVHLPLLQLPLWFLYENAMPRDMNIRVDLLLIFPGMLIAALVYVSKIAWLLFIKNQLLRNAQKAPVSRKPTR